ncbi:hypothetical protein D3879_24795 [Pseudomonas cavernicola]|uniref:Uncharacterized protein n=1 Tax=Pseudomonas cavernicola TaxID=2320866 RepID=A0A418X977_9PSED|nr:hypothetical protein [Pseudomonas cavernicola]RJG09036.1 hypothetical protein D3879_24795 [Pseudomonas cavernicola]
MSSSDRPVYRLTLEAPEPGLGVIVIDAEGNVVGRCADDKSRLDLDLPRGLYTVRSSRSGAFAETVVRLDGPQLVKAAPPPVFSAATIPGAATTHEYYTWPAWAASQTPTAPLLAWDEPADARLLLFVRAAHQGAYAGEDQLASLSLRMLNGRSLSEFRDDAQRDSDKGWAAYSTRLPHGLLILEDLGERPRQIPVPLMPGWQTQVFVMHHKRLLWEDMRLATLHADVIDSRKYRSPYDLQPDDIQPSQDMDAGLLALQNNTPSVAPQLIDAFLGSKFQNPILGLLGAYLMLLHERREAKKPDYHADTGRIRMVLDNLHALLPESADVAALRLMAEPWLGKPALAPVERVPLFRCGAEALLQAAASDPALLPEGSLLDTVSDRLYGDTVWTTWKPVALPLGMYVAANLPGAGAMHETNWVEQAVVDAVSVAEHRGEDFTADDLVRRIGVSPHAVRNAMDRLITRAATQRLLPDVAPQDIRLLGGKVARTLADTLGLRVDESLLAQIASGPSSVESATMTPSIQQVYSRLKKALSEVAAKQAGKISADSVLTEIIRPDDALGRTLFSKRLARQFSEHNIALSNEELDATESVRDLAHLMARKLSE